MKHEGSLFRVKIKDSGEIVEVFKVVTTESGEVDFLISERKYGSSDKYMFRLINVCFCEPVDREVI